METQPFYILFNGIDILHILLNRIRIVVPQIAFAVVFFCRGKIQAYGFRMPDVKVSVWFRRKPGMHSVSIFMALQILIDNIMNKI